jgi:hypothetical protein
MRDAPPRRQPGPRLDASATVIAGCAMAKRPAEPNSNSDCKSGSTSIFDMTTNFTSAAGLMPGSASDDPSSNQTTSVRACDRT